MATENLKVKITADASQAKAEIGKFKDSLKGAVSEGEAATKSIGKMTAALGGMLATLKVVKTLIRNGIDIAAQGDAIKDNAQKVFMNTTAYQEWGYVLKQNGIEMSALKTAMRQFAPQVASGSEALRKYGITATDVDTAFQQAIYTIQNMATESERIAAATELFGSRALELFPVLNLTNAETQNLMNTYRALGGTMSNELIAASDVCTDSITAMKAAWGGLRNVLAQYFLPIITKVVRWITIAIAYIRILLSAIFGLKSSFGSVGSKKNSLPATTGSVATNTGNTAGNLKKAAKHAKELKRTLMGIDELTKLVEQATSSASSPSGGGGGGGGGVGDIGGGDIGDFSDIIGDDAMDKIEKFRKKVEAVKDLLNGAYLILKGMVEISLGNFAKGWEDIKEGVKKVWDNLKELFPWLGKVEEGFGKLKDKWEDFKKNFKDITANIKAQIASKWSDLKAKWEEIVNNIKDKVADMKAKIATKWSDVKTSWNNVVDNIKDKTADMKAKVATKWSDIKTKWHNVVDNIKAKTVDMKAKVASKWSDLRTRWNSLLAHFRGKTVDIGLKFSVAAADLKSWINTHVIGKINNALHTVPILKNVSIPYLAKGGVLTAPTMAMMGEYPGARSNPEIATPQSLMAETIRDANGDLVSAFAQMTRQVIAAIEDKDLAVRIGDEAIARSAQRGNTAYRNRTGKALITI